MQLPAIKRPHNLIVFLAIIFVITSVSLAAANMAFMMTNEIYQGVTIGEVPVGGLSAQEAQAKVLREFEQRTKEAPIVLEYQGKTWQISAEDIHLAIDATSLADQAYNIGRNGSIISRLQERYVTINSGYVIPWKVTFDGQKLDEILAHIAQSVDKEAVSARIVRNGFNVSIVPEVIGHKTDIAQTKALIMALLNNRLPVKGSVIVSDVTPDIVSSDLDHIDGIIASYTTQFNPSDQNRTQNIGLAAKNINGVLVHSGETFSFNHYVGLRLSEYGYKEAPVFIDGKLVPDWGGGVCQVSSTLYNAVLLSDMSIEERTSHFRPPGYVPLGQDATVADNLLDFRFKNTSADNIYIADELTDNQITVYVFGRRSANPPDIRIVATDKKILEPSTIVKQDPTLDLGKEVVETAGQKGFLVTTYRIKYQNGQEIGREFLATDEYEPVDAVTRVGTKVTSPAAKLK